MAPPKSQNLVQAKVSYKRETQGERQGEAKREQEGKKLKIIKNRKNK